MIHDASWVYLDMCQWRNHKPITAGRRSQLAELLTTGEDSGSAQLTRLTKVVKFVRLLRRWYMDEGMLRDAGWAGGDWNMKGC